MPYIGRELDSGNYLKLDDISSSFNGSLKTFNLTAAGKAFYPGSAFSILVNLAGVVQEPEAAYQINNATITFASAPVAGDQFFCIVLGLAHGINVPANGTVDGAQLKKPFNFDGFFYLDDTNNRVGVGTVTPQKPLHVVGEGQFDSVRVLGDLTVDGTTTTLDTVVTEVDRLEVGANNNTVGLAVTQSGSGDAAIFMGGKVGIGTDSPAVKLEILGANGDQLWLDNAGERYTQISLRHDGTTNGGLWLDDTDSMVDLYANASHGIRFKTGGLNTRATITSAGKIGIGTATPNWLTSISGGSGGTETTLLNLHVHSTSDSTGSILRFSNSTDVTSTYGTAEIRGLRTSNATGYTDLIFTTSDGNSVTEKVRIKGGTGSVGIGTITPQSQFEVFGATPIVRSKHSTQTYTQISNNGTDGYVDWSSGGLIFRGASNVERLRITSAGSLITGSGGVSETIGGGQAHIQSKGDLSILRRDNTPSGTYLNLAKSRNATPGSFTVLQDNDYIGSIGFCADDGTDMNHPVAYIHGRVNGTPGANDVPGMLTFATTPDGGIQPLERLRIASDGTITINTVSGTNNNANQAVLFQTAAGVIDGGSGLLYNPAEDALKVNGNIITSSSFFGAGAGPLMLAVANYSSTQYIKVSNKIEMKGNVGINTANPAVSLDLATNTDAVALPTGTTAQRPSGTDAYIRKNSTNNALEFYNGTEWVEIITDYFPTGSTILG